MEKKIQKALQKGGADQAGMSDEEYEQGMKELHFAGNAKKNFANKSKAQLRRRTQLHFGTDWRWRSVSAPAPQ